MFSQVDAKVTRSIDLCRCCVGGFNGKSLFITTLVIDIMVSLNVDICMTRLDKKNNYRLRQHLLVCNWCQVQHFCGHIP